MKTGLYLLLAAGAVGLGYVTASWLQRDGAGTTPEPAPAFELVDLNNQEHSNADYAGRVLLINFWASWCAPCLKEMPLLNATFAAHRDQGLAMLGPAIDDTAAASRLAADLDIRYPVTPGGGELFALMDAFGDDLGALPFTVLIDRQGNIVERHWGELSEPKLNAWLSEHL